MTVLLADRPSEARSHAAAGAEGETLARVHDAGVNLAIWRRSLAPRFLAALSEADFSGLERYEGTGTPAEIGSELAAILPKARLSDDLIAALAGDVADLATRFVQIMAIDRPAVRLERIVGDACRRFHADYMRVRLITTYRGAGTEWLSPEDGERIVEGRPPPDAIVHALDAGHVAMMKGRLLAPRHPLIHRSPPIRDSGRDRLVLVIDEPMARD